MLAVIATALSCSTSIFTAHPPATIRSAPHGPIVGAMKNGMKILVDDNSHGWLHIHSPKLGWIHTSTTFVNCGKSNNMEDVHNLRNLAIQGRHDRIALDTFVRFFADNGGKHQGMMQEEDAVDDFVDLMKFAPHPLLDALDQLTDQERKRMFSMAINRGDDFEQIAPTFLHALAAQPNRPAAISWRADIK